MKTGKQTRNVRVGDRGWYWQSAKVGDSHSALQLGVSPGGDFEWNISGTQFYNFAGMRVEGVVVGWRVREVGAEMSR